MWKEKALPMCLIGPQGIAILNDLDELTLLVARAVYWLGKWVCDIIY